MKWLKRILIAVVTFIIIIVLVIYVISNRHLSRKFDVPRVALTFPTDTESIARGEHVAIALTKCGACHGDDFGGKVLIDDGKFAHVYAPNLTRGKGGIGTWSDADFVTAVTHGIRPDGSALLMMPSDAYSELSHADLINALVYIRSRPAVDHEWPASSLGPLARMLVAIGQPLFPAEVINHGQAAPDSMPAAASAAYGKYLVTIGGCRSCHNPSLSGGPLPGAPSNFKVPANLTPAGLKGWTLGDLRRALRDGVQPSGTPIDTFMPWRYTKRMTDVEIEATWLYLQSLPPKEFGKQ